MRHIVRRATATPFVIVVGLIAVGCGGSTTAPAPASTTPAGADPSVLELAGWELPMRPHDVHWDEAPLEEGVAITRETIADVRPVLDPSVTPAAMRTYFDGALREWLLRRGHALADARTALGPAEDGQDAEHIVAAAIVGVLYADLGWQIAEIAIPRSVRDDELGALAMRNALLEMSAPLFDQALSAFGACASSAVGGTDPTVERWARFCDEESERLVDAPRPIATGDDDARDPDPGDD